MSSGVREVGYGVDEQCCSVRYIASGTNFTLAKNQVGDDGLHNGGKKDFKVHDGATPMKRLSCRAHAIVGVEPYIRLVVSLMTGQKG